MNQWVFFYITALGKCNNLVISETKKASENLHPFLLVNFMQRVGNEFLRELTINEANPSDGSTDRKNC